MSTPLKTLEEIQRLTSPFPESIAIQAWKARGNKVMGYACIYVPEEIMYAAGMMPFRVSGDNEEIETKGAEAYLQPTNCGYVRSTFQLALDGKYDFLDGLITAEACDGIRRMHENWAHYKKMAYMDIFYIPRKLGPDSLEMFLSDIEDWRVRLSAVRGSDITDAELRKAIGDYNRGRRLTQQLYGLRKRDRPPLTGSEALEVVKAAARLPRDTYNDLLEQLLDEIQRSGREIRRGKRLMIVGSDLHNSTWVDAIEALDAVVVTDELCTGTRYFWGEVDTSLPPMEALAHHYLSRPPCPRFVPNDRRFAHVFDMIEEYRVDGVVSETIRMCSPYCHDKPLLRAQMEERDIPILELDVEYGQKGSGQLGIRAEAFLELLRNRSGEGAAAKMA